VAVIQISKIQVRRGKKVSNTGVPQLSSAEFAWAIDSQELFIGNGSVAEGAPFVGNTKVLTEHDNILELAAAYRFGSTNPSIVQSVARSLQGKLEEYVSVADFGAVNDGSTDCTAAFQSAFLELFRNPNSTYKKVLLVPNGDYLFINDLRIPSTAIIRGETAEGAVLHIGANNMIVTTEGGLDITSTVGSATRPRNVDISNLTIDRTSGQLVITGLRDSKFSNIKFKGNYRLGDAVSIPEAQPAAVYWENSLIDIQVTDVEFNGCYFESNAISVKCTQSLPLIESRISFNDCKFFVNDIGVYVLGTDIGQSYRWTFNRSAFEEIFKQAFVSTQGKDTLFDSCDFKNCGNGVGSANNPKYAIVEFGQNINNRLVNCTSNRTQKIGSAANVAIGYSDAVNASVANFIDRNFITIDKTDAAKSLAVFNAINRYFYVDYVLHLSAYTRAGRLTITLDDDHTNTSITDEYQYSPFLTADRGGAIMTNFEFTVDLKNRGGDSTEETLVLSYTNPVNTGATGTISYNLTYGV
jgi:hypothetical protein